jgi:hypothetical protein
MQLWRAAAKMARPPKVDKRLTFFIAFSFLLDLK